MAKIVGLIFLRNIKMTSKTAHTFCVPNTCSGTHHFRLGTNDPGTLKTILNCVTDRVDRAPTFFANRHREEDETFDTSIPPEVICDTSCLPDIEVIEISSPSNPTEDCAAAIISDTGVTGTIIFDGVNDSFLADGLHLALLTLLDVYMSDADTSYGPFCNEDEFELYIIYDNKIALPMGKLIDGFGVNLRDTSNVLIFPNGFVSFDFVLYSLTTGKYYRIFRYP